MRSGRRGEAAASTTERGWPARLPPAGPRCPLQAPWRRCQGRRSQPPRQLCRYTRQALRQGSGRPRRQASPTARRGEASLPRRWPAGWRRERGAAEGRPPSPAAWLRRQQSRWRSSCRQTPLPRRSPPTAAVRPYPRARALGRSAARRRWPSQRQLGAAQTAATARAGWYRLQAAQAAGTRPPAAPPQMPQGSPPFPGRPPLAARLRRRWLRGPPHRWLPVRETVRQRRSAAGGTGRLPVLAQRHAPQERRRRQWAAWSLCRIGRLRSRTCVPPPTPAPACTARRTRSRARAATIGAGRQQGRRRRPRRHREATAGTRRSGHSRQEALHPPAQRGGGTTPRPPQGGLPPPPRARRSPAAAQCAGPQALRRPAREALLSQCLGPRPPPRGRRSCVARRPAPLATLRPTRWCGPGLGAATGAGGFRTLPPRRSHA
mmetsp:Transcript_18239/g.69011  ORF Transcript_18239/g.69011 Transcript_18239/m.69011 type:complete len:433 (+) Transcript_18239:900-2198(+)